MVSSQRNTLPGLIHDVSVRALPGARLRTSSALSISSPCSEPSSITRHGVVNGVVTVEVFCTVPEPRAVFFIRYVFRVLGCPETELSIERG